MKTCSRKSEGNPKDKMKKQNKTALPGLRAKRRQYSKTEITQ